MGNNREVWRAAYSINGTVTPASIIQQTSYYPSGLPWSDGTGVSIQPYKYNGKEFVEMNGLDTYDYGARGYYAAMGRFSTMDPLAEKRPWISPYAYCSGNPVNRIDPDGKFDGEPESGGTKTEKNKNGVDASPQSTIRTQGTNKIKSEHLKTSTPLQAAAKIAQSQPKGEIKDANQEKFKEMHNEAMNDPIKKQCLTDPVMQTCASAILGGGAGAVAKTVASDIAPLVFKSAQIAIENPNTTQKVFGVGIGLIVSKLSGQMQDVPSFTTGIPMIDNYSQGTQIVMTAVDFFTSIAPQTNVQPVKNTP